MPGKKKQPKAKHDWSAIRAEYVEAPSESVRPTLEALAVKHSCSPSYLREKASKEQWKPAADQYLASVSQVRREVKAVEVGTDLAQFDQQCLNLTKAAMKQIQVHLKTAIESNRPMGVKELKELTGALASLHKLGKEIIGEEETDQAEEMAADPSQYSQMSSEELSQLYQERVKRRDSAK